MAEHWTVDKRLPIATLIAIIAQSGAVVWWASGIDGRVDTLETHQSEQDSDQGQTRSLVFSQSNDIATLTERVDRVLELSRDTNVMLGKLIEQGQDRP